MKTRTHYDEIAPYVTKDGSEIRELMHPRKHAGRLQSLAEARVAPGRSTAMHKHFQSEEIYHVTAGTGRMSLGTEVFAIRPGDTIQIPPGTEHCLENTGPGDLCVLCACSPPYDHDDTALVGPA